MVLLKTSPSSKLLSVKPSKTLERKARSRLLQMTLTWQPQYSTMLHFPLAAFLSTGTLARFHSLCADVNDLTYFGTVRINSISAFRPTYQLFLRRFAASGCHNCCGTDPRCNFSLQLPLRISARFDPADCSARLSRLRENSDMTRRTIVAGWESYAAPLFYVLIETEPHLRDRESKRCDEEGKR